MINAAKTCEIKTFVVFPGKTAEKAFINNFFLIAFFIFCYLLVFPFAVQAQEPVLSVTPTFQDVPDTSSETSFEVENTGTGAMNWTASEDADWFSITPDSGTDNGTITVSYDANSGEARTGTITITAEGAAPRLLKSNRQSIYPHYQQFLIRQTVQQM